MWLRKLYKGNRKGIGEIMARKKGYRTRPNQIFVGELTDNELGLIEDALVYAKGHNGEHQFMVEKTADDLIMKLYKFW